MFNLQELTNKVSKIAIEAGIYLKDERKNFHMEKVEEKNTHDYVSYVDKESENRLVQALSDLLPEAGFITEEGSATYEDQPYCWVIDPLDGTTNYIHDNAPYCVSIALRNHTELLVGVVYEVCRNECFSAWRGGKAFLNGEEIHVSNVKEKEKAFVVVELPYKADQYKKTALHLIDRFYGVVSGIRMNGSAATALCYVAAGRFDAWAEAFIGKWDYSAAALIIMQAGGKVTDFYGDGQFIEGHHIVASNGYLHPLFIDLLAEVPPNKM
ncbi:MAG: inositol monophosphatase family protein [Bacteroidaceae bacterium]|nr:inositol monophosphatase [Bacteroidaceae bacterium]